VAAPEFGEWVTHEGRCPAGAGDDGAWSEPSAPITVCAKCCVADRMSGLAAAAPAPIPSEPSTISPVTIRRRPASPLRARCAGMSAATAADGIGRTFVASERMANKVELSSASSDMPASASISRIASLMSRLRRNDGPQCLEGAALELLHGADAAAHDLGGLVEREVCHDAQGQGLALVVAETMKQCERVLLVDGRAMHVFGRRHVPGIGIRVERDERRCPGAGAMVVDDPGVSDGERQGAHSILSSDDRRETRVQGKKDILGDRLGVVDTVKAKVPENTR
jgi:hypothetical protein